MGFLLDVLIEGLGGPAKKPFECTHVPKYMPGWKRCTEAGRKGKIHLHVMD